MGNNPSSPAPVAAPVAAPARTPDYGRRGFPGVPGACGWPYTPPCEPPPPTTFEEGKTPNVNLTVETSSQCNGCGVGIDNGLTSSAITLTRNILNQIQANIKVVLPPSNLPKTGNSNHTGDLGKPDCNGGCTYSPPFASNDPKNTLSAAADPPTLLSDEVSMWRDTGQVYLATYNAQKQREDEMIAKLTSAAANVKANRIWNPSDNPRDLIGSYAINYYNHGALTKLHLKPTLPFTVNYSGP